MKQQIFTVQAEGERYQAMCSKLAECPKAGVHHGLGLHVDMSDELSGWTIESALLVKHPTKRQWSHPHVDPDRQGNKSKLSADELATMRSLKGAETDLDATWVISEVDR